jgi:hypothetical protein
VTKATKRAFWPRRPVRRESADRYLFLTLVAFAATVIATRWYLELTGYPRIGGGELHIAHALLGGLFLFAAALLPILLAGRAVYRAAAVLAGIGIGLFIDEVGKFITTQNDYFYPAAAPIIYATFLLAVLIWVRIRRRTHGDPRGSLLRGLELLEEAVDGDLQSDERERLKRRLTAAAEHADEPEQRRLATTLLEFVNSGELVLAPSRADPLRPVRSWWNRRRDRWLGGRGLRMVIIVALFLSGAQSVVDLAWGIGQASSVNPATSTRLFSLELLHLVVDALAGVLLVAGAVLVNVPRRHRLGVSLAFYGLLVTLSLADLASFYLRQFSALETSLFHLLLLGGLVLSRRELRSERMALSGEVQTSADAGQGPTPEAV